MKLSALIGGTLMWRRINESPLYIYDRERERDFLCALSFTEIMKYDCSFILHIYASKNMCEAMKSIRKIKINCPYILYTF